MRDFANMPLLGVWYAHLDIEDAVSQVKSQLPKKGRKLSEKELAKARTRDSMQALAKLTTMVDGQRRIISDPPLIVPVEDLFADMQADALYAQLNELLGKYLRTLQSDRRYLVPLTGLRAVVQPRTPAFCQRLSFVWRVEYNAAGATITTFRYAIWWAVVTTTTVGYGDYTPVTLAGRVIATVVMIMGIGLLGTASATIAAWFVTRRRVGPPMFLRGKLSPWMPRLPICWPCWWTASTNWLACRRRFAPC
jgi:Ion channel/Uncharacterized protein conserved in bacteria (DUF2252)